MPLGRLSAVPGSHAAGLPVRLLGLPQQDGGKQNLHVYFLCVYVCVGGEGLSYS